VGEAERGLTIEELAARVGVPVRTIRFYITEGLLPGPGARGRGASYGREHLLRLRLIRRLTERRVPIAEIRDTVARLPASDVDALLAEEDRRAAELERTPPATSPKAYVAALLARSRPASDGAPGGPSAAPEPRRGGPAAPRPAPARGEPPAAQAPPAGATATWQRTELAPGVELHVRGDAAVRHRDLIARLRGAAGAPGAPGDGRHTDPADGPASEDETGTGTSGGKG
jgi:DNA-binding transcriptional MerR regulator